MNWLKLIRIEAKNFLKLSVFSLVLLFGLLVMLSKLAGEISTISTDTSLLSFYFLLLVISSSYATVFLLLVNVDKEKINKVYHRYFVAPLKPHILFALKLLPLIFSSFLITLACVLILHSKFSTIKFPLVILSILDAFIFIVGVYLLFFAWELIVKNVTLVFAVRFVLVYVFSYFPSFLLRNGVSANTLIYGLVIFSILVFIAGIYFISHINTEKVVLS